MFGSDSCFVCVQLVTEVLFVVQLLDLTTLVLHPIGLHFLNLVHPKFILGESERRIRPSVSLSCISVYLHY